MSGGARVDGVMAVLVQDFLRDVDCVATGGVQFDVKVDIDAAAFSCSSVGGATEEV